MTQAQAIKPIRYLRAQLPAPQSFDGSLVLIQESNGEVHPWLSNGRTWSQMDAGGGAQGATVVAGLVLDNPAPAVIAANMALIQAALDKKGRVEIHGDGTLYWPGDVIAKPGNPGALKIGSNTSFMTCPSLTVALAPGSLTTTFLSNKSFIGNRVRVNSMTVGPIFGAQNNRRVTLALNGPLAVTVGDFFVILGDEHGGYNLDDGYKIESVNTPGAATQITFITWQDEAVGYSLSALDNVYVYKAEGDFSVDIQGPISIGGNVGAGGLLPQSDYGILMFCKVVNARINIEHQTDGPQAKTIVMAAHFYTHIPFINVTNAGAGLCVLGPAKMTRVGTIRKTGGEDALLIQTMNNYSGQSEGLLDADNTRVQGSIRGVHVELLQSYHARLWPVTMDVTNDYYDVTKPLSIDGVRIDRIEQSIGSGCDTTFYIRIDATAPGTGGGNLGEISIGELFIADDRPLDQEAGAIFNFDSFQNPNIGKVCGGVTIDNLIYKGGSGERSLGLRQLLFIFGSGMTGAVLEKFLVKSANVAIDQQNRSASWHMGYAQAGNAVDLIDIKGRFVAHAMLQAIAVQAAGTGYAAGNVLVVQGGAGPKKAKLRVATVSTGGVATFDVISRGDYTVLPTSPVSVTGGAGTGATFSFANTYQTCVAFRGNDDNSLIRKVNLNDSHWELYGNSALGRGTPSTAAVTKYSIKNTVLKMLCLFDLSENLDADLQHLDFTNVTCNLSHGGFMGNMPPNKTYNFTLGGVKGNASNPAIFQTNTPATNVTINVRSLGGNSGFTNASNSFVWNYIAGVTINYFGNCADWAQDLSLITVGRNDGTILNNIGTAVGTPAAIGPGLVACFGTAAGSWKPLNPTRSANSF